MKKREKVGNYRLVEGPRLKQILVQRQAITPITKKIRVVTKNPMIDFLSHSLKIPLFLCVLR